MKEDYLKVSEITFKILISAEFCHQIIPQWLEFGSDDSSNLNTSKQNTRLLSVNGAFSSVFKPFESLISSQMRKILLCSFPATLKPSGIQ